MTLTTGEMLQSRYRVVALLGQGGMGAVYRAWDTRLNIPVAVKEQVPQPDLDAETLARMRQQFIQKAQTLARLDHPHLVNVSDYFEEDDKSYLVMKYVEGVSLAERIEEVGALGEAQVLTWAAQLLAALAYCHQQGVLHRDLKPQNVVITPTGEAVLVDFGLVKLWDPNDPRTRTAIRGAGTPEYAPPEQYDTVAGHTDARSDIYSLGATLYHALAGQAPPTATQRMVDPKALRPLHELNAHVSPQLEEVVHRAMEPQPGHRFHRAEAMAVALRPQEPTTHLAEPTTALQPEGEQTVRQMPATRTSEPSKSTSAWWRAIPIWGWAVGMVMIVGGVLVLGGREPAALTIVPDATDTSKPTSSVSEATGDLQDSTPTATPTEEPAPTSTNTPPPTETPQPEEPSAGLAPSETWIRPIDGAVMVYVPAGEFERGSFLYGNERPEHTVSLDDFWLDQTEVTNAQFAAFLNEQGNQAEGGVTWLDVDADECLIEQRGGTFHPKDGYADHPVVEISWFGATAYCTWAESRLPTEAEWEYAARGPESLNYPWGNKWQVGLANCADDSCEDGYEQTAPVGSFPAGASWVGAYDLAGNVFEWINDWHAEDYYERSPQDNPTGPASGTRRGLRGGSWLFAGGEIRGAARWENEPTETKSYYGFRCAASSLPGE